MTNEESINPIPEETPEGDHKASTPETTEPSIVLPQESSPAIPEADFSVKEIVTPVEVPPQEPETPAIPAEAPALPETPAVQAEAPAIPETPAVQAEAPAMPEIPAVPAEAPALPETMHIAPPPKREKPQKLKLSEEDFAPVWEELTKEKDAETVLTVKCIKAIRGGALV